MVKGFQLRWVLVGSLVLLAGCHTTPITGRRQLLLMPAAQELQMGATAYQETLAGEQLSTNADYQQMVQRVGDRLAHVAQRPDFQW